MSRPKQIELPEVTYPSIRHHKSGVGTIRVNSEEHEAELESKEPGIWFKTPQPKPVPPPPRPVPTVFELLDRIERLEKYLSDTNETLSEVAAVLDHPKIQKLIGGS